MKGPERISAMWEKCFYMLGKHGSADIRRMNGEDMTFQHFMILRCVIRAVESSQEGCGRCMAVKLANTANGVIADGLRGQFSGKFSVFIDFLAEYL